jgi:hypothetical protein
MGGALYLCIGILSAIGRAIREPTRRLSDSGSTPRCGNAANVCVLFFTFMAPQLRPRARKDTKANKTKNSASKTEEKGKPDVTDDVVDLILTLCPTFATLQSTILVSKAFYEVFKSREKVCHLKSFGSTPF